MATTEFVHSVSRRSALRLLGGAAVLAAGSATLSACGASSGGVVKSGGNRIASGGTWAITGGTGKAAGLATIAGTKVTLIQRGDDCWGQADTCTFLNAPSTATTGSWMVYVSQEDPTNPWTKAGIMARNSLDPASACVFLVVTPGNGVVLQYREHDGDNEGATNPDFQQLDTTTVTPVWLRLDKDASDNWTGSMSTDGKTWTNQTPAAQNPINLNSKYLVGLATTAHDATMNGNSVFSNLSGFSPLPTSIDAVGTNDTAPK